MKKALLLLALAGAIPLTSMAQDDDLYFTPSKEKAVKSSVDNTPAYYSGISKGVDDYNRRGKLSSYYQKIGTDSLGNDIITFQPGDGVYPDSTHVDTAFVYPGSATYDDTDDYTYTRRMARWDGYYDPWFYDNYYWGSYRYGWYDPWYYGYAGWYGPWYYGGYGGWYAPWYYGYYGWGYPYRWDGWYGPRGGYAWGSPGTRNHGSVDRGNGGGYGGRFGTRRDDGSYASGNGATTPRRFGARSNSGFSNTRSNHFGNDSGSRTFGSRSYTPSQPTSSFGGTRSSGFSGGGSFGGSRSGGFSGGGGHTAGGGGGHFGGRR